MKSLRQGLGRQSQRSPSRSDRKKSSQEAKRSVTGDDRPPVCSCPLRCKTKSAPGGCRRRNTRMQTDARPGGNAQRFRFPCSTNNARRASPRIAGACAHKNEITCAWSTLHLVCRFGEMIAHCLKTVKHIVRFCALTARNFGLFGLDSGVHVPYNFSQC